MAASHRDPGEYPHTRDELIEAIRDFLAVHGHRNDPGVIFVPRMMEQAMHSWIVGDTRGTHIFAPDRDALRKATVFGMHAIYDAPMFTLAYINQEWPSNKYPVSENHAIAKASLALAYYYGVDEPNGLVFFHPAF